MRKRLSVPTRETAEQRSGRKVLSVEICDLQVSVGLEEMTEMFDTIAGAQPQPAG